MKVLIDECAPVDLKTFIAERGLECLTVQEAGWSGKQNGELLSLAESQFDVFVTVDANLSFQQDLARRPIAVILLLGPSNRLMDLTPLFPDCLAAIRKAKPGAFVTVGERN
jgi:predicted nuclease of predicted toxin-antitoxin system